VVMLPGVLHSAFALNQGVRHQQYAAHNRGRDLRLVSKGQSTRAHRRPGTVNSALRKEFGLFRFDGVRKVSWRPPPVSRSLKHIRMSANRRRVHCDDGTLDWHK